MTQPEAVVASRVCSTCKARKKGCDKSLPTCGYCSKRSLPCWYTPYSNDPALIELPDDTSESLRSLQALAWNHNDHLSFDSFNLIRATSSLRTSSSDQISCATDKSDFDKIVYAYVSYVLECIELPVAQLYHHFFGGFHQWLPMISHKRLIEKTRHLRSGVLDSPNCVLLLAMCLIVLRPSPDTQVRSLDGIKNLYLAVKSCFAKTQAIFTATVPLVQAGILTAAYEYASRRPETAYVSIRTSAAMANLLGLDRSELNEVEDWPGSESMLKSLEERNVWWSIIILER